MLPIDEIDALADDTLPPSPLTGAPRRCFANPDCSRKSSSTWTFTSDWKQRSSNRRRPSIVHCNRMEVRPEVHAVRGTGFARQRGGRRHGEVRGYLGFNQAEVARHLGTPQHALSECEGGRRSVDALELARHAKPYEPEVDHFTERAPVGGTGPTWCISHEGRPTCRSATVRD